MSENKSQQTTPYWLMMVTVTFLIATHSGIAFAEESLPQEPYLPLSMATKAATTALTKCEEGGYRVSVAVVDRGGNLRIIVRGDGAGPHTIDSSTKKAYTASSIRRSTMELAALIAKMPSLQALRDMNEQILILGGGLPITIGGEIVGGIGVGGAPGAHLDEACAQAGLDLIGASTPSKSE